MNMLYKIYQFLLTLLIGIVSIIGDKIIDNTNNIILRAVIDNLTHGLVAGISWTLILILQNDSIINNIQYIILSMAISSLIDIDHFIVAQSWRLNAAINLDQRPFFHCTTIPIVLWLLILQISKLYESTKWENFSWILLISFLSHHIRDGTRRGIWLSPFGTTKPIPYYIYILIDMILPYILYFLINRWRNKFIIYRGIINIV